MIRAAKFVPPSAKRKYAACASATAAWTATRFFSWPVGRVESSRPAAESERRTSKTRPALPRGVGGGGISNALPPTGIFSVGRGGDDSSIGRSYDGEKSSGTR